MLLLALLLALPRAPLAALPHGSIMPPPPARPPPSHYGGPTDVPGGAPPRGAGTPAPPIGGPAAPAAPSTPGPQGAGPSTQGPLGGGLPGTELADWVDEDQWWRWWELNKASYLHLKERLYAGGPRTGEAELAPAQLAARLRPDAELIAQRAVPALRAALAGQPDKELHTSALIALARLSCVSLEAHVPFEAELFLPALRHANQEIAETAALALGIARTPAAIDPLLALLRDDEAGHALLGRREVPERTRAFAAFGLGLIAEASRIPEIDQRIGLALLEVLQQAPGSTADLRAACVLATGLVPLPYVPPAARAAGERSGAPGVAHGLLRQIELVGALLEDGKQPATVRAHAPVALTRLLARLPEPEREPQRLAAMAALGRRLQRSAREPSELQIGCAQALGLLADADKDAPDAAARALLEELSSSASDVRLRALATVALARAAARAGSGPERLAASAAVAEELGRRLERSAPALRAWSALALGLQARHLQMEGALVPASIVPALRAAFDKSRSPDECAALAIALGLARDTDSTERIADRVAALREERARGYCAVALGMLCDAWSTERLRAVVTEAGYRPRLLREAAVGLGLIGDARTVETLLEMLQAAKTSTSLASIATALGWVGDARAVAPLAAVATDAQRSDNMRAFAVIALGLVCDTAPLPWYSGYATDANYFARTSTLYGRDGAGLLNIF